VSRLSLRRTAATVSFVLVSVGAAGPGPAGAAIVGAVGPGVSTVLHAAGLLPPVERAVTAGLLPPVE
jgi:hypothetical protein